MNSGDPARGRILEAHARTDDLCEPSEARPARGGTMTARGWARRSPTTRCLRLRRSCWWPPRSPAWCSAPRRCAGEIVGAARSPRRPRRRARGAGPSRSRQPAPPSGIVATLIGGITFLIAVDRRVPRVAGRVQHHLARQAQAERASLCVRDGSRPLVWPGGGDRLPAAGLARGHRGARRAQRVALQPVPRQRARCGPSSTRWSRSW